MYSLTSRERVFTLVGIIVGLFLGALDQTIVGTAMPLILRDLNGLNLYTWVVTAYLLMSTAMIPIYGKLSDLYGRKIIVLIGIGVFLVGSALSGQSRSMTELIAFRAVQGLGSAAIFSSAFTVVGDIFPPAERGKYQGLFGAVFGIASVVGPWLGGLLTDGLSWRWVFYVNVPVGVVAMLFIALQMPPLRGEPRNKVVIDWTGSALLLLGILPLLLALSLGGAEYAWGSWQVIGMFGLAAAGIALFIWVETRAKEPILPFDLFQNRTFVIANASALLIGGVAFFGAVIFLPIFMVLVTGASASQAGLTITPLVLGVVVGSFLAGQIVSRLRRYKAVVLCGIALTVVGYLLMQGISVNTTRSQMTWRMVVLGLGIGPALPVFVLAIQNAVKPHEMGAATSSSQFFRQIGSTVGVAVFGTILTAVLTIQLPRNLPAEMKQIGAAAPFNMGALQSGDLSVVDRQIKAEMQKTYNQIELALTSNDPAAEQSLLANPQLSPQLREILQNGGVQAEVKAGLDSQYQSIAAALSSGSAARIREVLADPRLPAPLRSRISSVPAGSFANPHVLTGVLAGVKQGLDASEPAIVAQTTQTMLSEVHKNLDAETAGLTAQVTQALKVSFTDAVKTVYFWGLFVVILGLVVTFFLPEIPLRTTANVRMTQASGDTGDGDGNGNGPGIISGTKQPIQEET